MVELVVAGSVVLVVAGVVVLLVAVEVAGATVDTERIVGSVESDSPEFGMVEGLVVLSVALDTGHQLQDMKDVIALEGLVTD